MSDIEPLNSDDDSHIYESFDNNELKFDEDTSYPNKKEPSLNAANYSVDFYSTTYVSTKKPNGSSKTEMDPDLDILDNDSLGILSDSDSEISLNDKQNVQNSMAIPKNEELKMIYARNYINKVEKSFKERDNLTINIRNEIVQCKQRLEELEAKREDIFNKLEHAQLNNNITVANRLDREHANICDEIDLENRVLEKLKENFDKADLQRSKALLEKTKYAPADYELKKNEEVLKRQKDQKAAERVQTEQLKVATLMQKLQKTKQLEEEKVRIESEKQKEAIEQAKIARQVASHYLQTTLREMKEKKFGEQNENQQNFEQRRKDILNLKQTIDQNREIYQAKLNKKKFLETKRKEELEEEKKRIIERGENPNFFIPRKQKIEDYERTKKKFDQEQEKNRKVIIKKIIDEEANMEKKKRLYPNLFNINLKPIPPKNKDKANLKKLNTIAKCLGLIEEKSRPNENDDEFEVNRNDESEVNERRSLMETTTIADENEDDSDFDELNNQEEMLVKPEFEGLWNKKLKAYDVDDLYKTQFKFPPSFKSKAERELYLKSLEKLKKSAIKDQVAAGKKFKGVAFKSQPKIIQFKDFDVGQTYNLKVVLTNISYTINTCKLIGLSDKLKDFVTIDFQPPGQMSAGLTCEFNVTFEPKINKDLEGEVEFLSTNGRFSIPIRCAIKKCDMSVNTNSVHFGTIVIAEKSLRKIQLINKGALGTNFEVLKLSEFKKKSKEEKTENETTESSIELGELRKGPIAPFSNVDLEFIFSPTFPGKFQEEYVIKFDDPNSKEIYISAKGTSIDVPIWIENINVDLKICMYERLYQDVLRVHNRANAALRITFDVPNELKNHLEILPKTAFIQARSEFLAQIKFIAKKSLAEDASSFFDSETGVLEVPLHIQVADQNKTVNYSLHAIITTSDLEFDITQIDFGYCTIYETARATVRLTNKSILCQPFGFVKLPDYVSVQPNDGFGTLLPNETIELDINFSPKSAKDYSFSVTCKSLVNRDFTIECRGVGVHPPLRLSAQRVNFKAVCLNSTAWRTLYVMNDHVDYEQHRHPVPRIGDGEMATVGPTYFEFDVPSNAPFELWPRVACVEPGQKVKVTIRYTANLNESDVKQEAVKLIKRRMADKTMKISPTDPTLATNSSENIMGENKPVTKKKAQNASRAQKNESALSQTHLNDQNRRTPDPNTIDKNSQDYLSGLQSALSNYEGGLYNFQIPCYISTAVEDRDPTKSLKYSIHNTLYIDIVCPSIKPELIVVSGKDSTRNIDFGKVSVGQKCIRKVLVKNISSGEIPLSGNLVNPNGPFSLLNSLRPLPPGQTHTLIFAFIPQKSSIFQETFELQGSRSNLEFSLNGVGIEPSFTLSFDGNSLDFGYCLANEKSEKSIEMKNNSKVPIEFKVSLDSDDADIRRGVEFKRFGNLEKANFKSIIGPNNYFGSSNFDVFPVQGFIGPGSKVDLKVSFHPDHSSELYSDTMRIIMVSNEKNSKVIQLSGKSRANNMYVRGVDHLTGGQLSTESMLLVDLADDNSGEEKEEATKKAAKPAENKPKSESSVSIPIPILVTLYSMPSHKTPGEFTQAEKLIHIGCMRSSSEKKDAKKSGDFTFDNLKEINTKGFNIDLTRSAVEAGGERQVKITWKPVPGFDPKETVQSAILLTTKSNSIETWRLIIQGRVATESYHVS